MAAATSPATMSFTELELAGPLRNTTIDDVQASQMSPQPNSPGPLPLPCFVFPAREPSQPSTSPRSAPSSYSRASGRRPLSAIDIRSGPRDGPRESGGNGETLPAFSFGGSPGLSSPRSIPARPSSMHQRNVSEFIGGDGKTGAGAGLMSTSPTKSEGALPTPPSTFGPPGGRRGHAHRRSAAISVSDLTFILKPNASARGESAPTSPSAAHEHYPPGVGSLNDALQSAKSMPEFPNAEPSPKAIKNTRVGFSDEVSIIPRPLSMVSSDSASTVRPGHSVSNSMSSIISGGASSPSTKDRRNVTSAYRMAEARPRTAEPFFDKEEMSTPDQTPRRRGSLPQLSNDSTESTPSTPRSAKKWSFFGHENASGESSPKSRPTSAASSAKEKPEASLPTPELTQQDIPVPSSEPCSRRSSISRKPSKNKKKVTSWAGSILSRKSRQRKQKLSRRSPTPPLRAYTPIDQIQDVQFMQLAAPVVANPQVQTDFTNWKPRKVSVEESMSPIIDLDAALGPFNTPSSFGDDWDVSQQNGKRKRAMHSAAGVGNFTGPGMHYHRRAESAPELPNPRFGLHRLGSSSTMGMEDVFEEDEDEEWEDTKASDKETSSKAEDFDDEEDTGVGIDIKVVDSDGMDSDNPMDFDDAAFQHGIKRKGSGLSESDRRLMSSTKSAHSTTSLLDEPIEEEADSPVEIVDDSIPPRPDSRAQSSDSTATPPFRPRSGKELAPVDIQPFSLQPQYATSPRSTTQSSFPSPRSPFSYDTQRISTAPSSVTGDNAFQSLLMGEPGPELLRMSVDDVPSLTSSNSTMTRDNVPQPQFRDGQRSASLSSAAITRKRSSMASLSRLISSSHGEKSKLSIESRAPSVMDGEKKEKSSKGKRISRLMQFWKPKETT